ncbi:hypothetical protein [Thalassobacillus devorans]|uniref:hypothetical protein n=1 Tax=Thalassobacillus devorans TaxID=279813 RepID=UPI00048FF367|nr:hypothetical protein [Thalassobacillus devorans]
MKRYIALLLMPLILSASFTVSHENVTQIIASDLEESITGDTSFSSDGSNEKKTAAWMLSAFSLIIIAITIAKTATSNFIVERSFLTAVFYQSNNVITTPLLT